MMRKTLLLAGLLAWTTAQAGYAEGPIELVVRGDDMGYSHDTNLSIIKAYKEGILTSVSVQTPGQYADEAFALCKANPGLSGRDPRHALGLHSRAPDSALRGDPQPGHAVRLSVPLPSRL